MTLLATAKTIARRVFGTATAALPDEDETPDKDETPAEGAGGGGATCAPGVPLESRPRSA
jgi:hypothetical protein